MKRKSRPFYCSYEFETSNGMRVIVLYDTALKAGRIYILSNYIGLICECALLWTTSVV
jgi:hypothetical protein